MHGLVRSIGVTAWFTVNHLPVLGKRLDAGNGQLQVERTCGSSVPGDETQKAVQCFCFMSGQCITPTTCSCFQGCSEDVVQHHRLTATFRNINNASSCSSQTSSALLTIPRKYFRSIDDLLQSCSLPAAHEIVEEALAKSFEIFQERSHGPVQQCIHAPNMQTVRWMHIHSLCGDGSLDGMPGVATESWCGNMTSSSEASSLASKMLQWGQNLTPAFPMT
eukprot:symbB.v1.2.010808.t1/scaffold712.1/size170421/7